MDNKRIAITGIGVVSSIGIGKDEFWQNIFAGKSGVKPITLFDTSDVKVKVGGEISGFDAKAYLGNTGIQDFDRASLLLSTAAKLALDDKKLEINDENSSDVGVSVGTTFGSLYSISSFDRESYQEGPRYVNPSLFPRTVGNSPASRVGIKFKIKGFNATISNGMSASLDAIEYGRNNLIFGRAKKVIAAAVEDLSIQVFLGFNKLNYLSGVNGGEPLSCPFDRRRNGIIFSEGSAALILEENNQAENAYANIEGVGYAFDPTKFYRYNPKAEGMIRAMCLALEDAGLEPKDIDCIFANANSTKDADIAEVRAIKEVFGSNTQKIPVTAIKSMLGEAFSASAGLATIAAIGAMQKGKVPASINYKEKDPDCDLNLVVNKPLEKKLSRVMINSFGPNGANTVLIIGRPK